MKQTLAASLERIQAVYAELRQAEALEAQLREMVVMKRNRLDALMTEHLEMATRATPEFKLTVQPTVQPEMKLSSFGSIGAPKDLLEGRPAPTAQHVLDSLNRLMGGA